MELLRAQKLFVCGIFTALMLPVGCSSDDGGMGDTGNDDGTAGDGDMTGGDDGGDDGGMTANGVTACGMFGLEEVSCQAGQYCFSSVLAECRNGCLSDENCTAEQTCDKAEGEDVGECQNGGPSLEQFCTKLLTCEAGTMEQCELVYNGTNEACHSCIVGSNCGDIDDCDSDCGL